jgi:two-component system, sensor histidine kinase and response regulator
MPVAGKSLNKRPGSNERIFMPEPPLTRIIIVDDEVVLMKALSRTLKDHGFETAGFSRGDAALAALRESRFDLLLSDLMMPEMDGIAVLRAALEIDPDLVGIIMTGAGTISTAVEAMKSGAFDYILKPFKLNAILPVLSRAVALRELRIKNAALERKVRQRTAQLEVVNKELEAFAYTVSHDLRAPLRHISSYVQFLTGSKTSTLSEQDRGYLDNIVGATVRMTRLIDDLLAFSRMGLSDLQQTSVDPQVLLEEALRQIQPEIGTRNIVWKKNPLPPLQADPALLRQVFINLLSNAVKYTRQRDPAEIEIGCLPESADEITIFVRDNGAGFDMKYAPKLFGVFQRLHRQEEFEGTGVGLANVRRIIVRHGGRTWAEGKVGGGATFYFTLPRKTGEGS